VPSDPDPLVIRSAHPLTSDRLFGEGAVGDSVEESGDDHLAGAMDLLRVLIVDDAPSTRKFLQGVLDGSRQFVVVGEASDGQDAIDEAGRLQPDLVLLDLSMPVVDGARALNGIIEIAPRAIVIILSGSRPSVGDPLLEAGAAAFVPKGIAPYELIRRLEAIAGRAISFEEANDWRQAERTHNGDPSSVSSHGRAVIYESEPLTRQLIAQVLKGFGVAVVAETNSLSILLSAVELAQPEFVVADVSLGGKPSVEVLQDICRRSPRTAVVVYSGVGEWRESALAAGAAGFAVQPQLDDLVDSVSVLTKS
jgi:DNA-binding NarL/FixJ family response regulator